MTKIEERICEAQSEPLKAESVKILQVNLGYRCNMSCRHCHVNASPLRTELMGKETIEAVLRISRDHRIKTIDLTGGAPELNPHFRFLIGEARRSGRHVVARTNLTIFFEKGMEDLPDFYAGHNIEITASLPHYSEVGTDRVRGGGTFSRSIEALRRLNSLGYGLTDERRLNLVYNPLGSFLPPSQAELEEQYKKALGSLFGIVFNRLYVFANMPIGRFRDFLVRSNSLKQYMDNAKGLFNPDTLNNLMCRYLISIGWDGRIYDCDFNQMLGLPVNGTCSPDIRDFDYAVLAGRRIVMGSHCFVCTAGQGST
ncbi:MAG TPA: arsenosugar biosynthesis radical SAM (seleno)protein ArsS [Thermodesulfovibrionales bacterium]|nr:arsenosugar biosynthesis radical SAM (seleno)protein ArsS [Thermodesulfovibrionales bacterium]